MTMDEKTKKRLKIAGGTTVVIVGLLWLLDQIKTPGSLLRRKALPGPSPLPMTKIVVDSRGYTIGDVEFNPVILPGGEKDTSVATAGVLDLLEEQGVKPPTRILINITNAPHVWVDPLLTALTDAGFKTSLQK